jgi:uncharacterized membrane protein
MQSRARQIGLGAVLILLAITLVGGLWLKTRPDVPDWACPRGLWSRDIQYTRLCYSDIVPLYSTEQLQGGRVPFLEACQPGNGECDEYPVLTMLTMYLAARPAGGNFAAFFLANVFFLTIAAVINTVALYLMVGRRALWFALSPTLLIYGYMNWDLIAVAFATAATAAFLRRRDVLAGVLLGLGTASKLYPLLLVVAFAAERFRERKPDPGIHLVWAALGSWLVVNLPFALFGFHDWTEFFRFNSHRVADFDSVWFIACRHLGHWACIGSTNVLNALWVLAFLALAGGAWLLRWRRQPNFPLWTLGLPFVVAFLLVNKVYSPQYGLWLIPWFALALPGLGRLKPLALYALFEVTDVAVFLTRFTYFGRLDGHSGATHWMFEVAVLSRAMVLLLCLAAWVLQREGPQTAPAEGQEREAARTPGLTVREAPA